MSEENTNRKGRTREVLAIVGGLGGLGVLCYLAIKGNETALGAVVSTISSIFGFYFAAKTAEGTR